MWTTIGEYIRTITDFVASGSFATLRQNVRYYKEPNYAILVRTQDFQNNFSKGLVYTDKHGYDFLSNSNLYGGELILPNIGASIGKIFVVPHLDKKMTLAPNSIMLRFWESQYQPWVEFYFRSPQGQSALLSISSATAQGKFSKTDFKELLIPVPPIDEQKRICGQVNSLLATINDIENGERSMMTLVSDSKAKILELAIHGKLVPQEPSDEPAIELLKRINPGFTPSHNLHYLDCPSGWAVTQMKSIIDLLSGRDSDNSRCNTEGYGAPYLVGASCIDNGRINIYRWTETPEVISKEGDVLLSCKGTVGEVVLNTLGDLHIARQFMAIRSKAPQYILPDYLMIFIKASIETLKKAARGIIPGISREDILELTVMIPPIEEQQRILSRIVELNQSVSLIVANTCD